MSVALKVSISDHLKVLTRLFDRTPPARPHPRHLKPDRLENERTVTKSPARLSWCQGSGYADREQQERETLATIPKTQVARLVCPSCGGVLDDVDVAADLTPVERELLDLLLHGYRVGQIAPRLDVSVSTVRKRVRRLLAKTGTRSQAELIAACRRPDRRARQSASGLKSARRSRSPRT
jgi:DNA-binding CsgD family transcriptional regulator